MIDKPTLRLVSLPLALALVLLGLLTALEGGRRDTVLFLVAGTLLFVWLFEARLPRRKEASVNGAANVLIVALIALSVGVRLFLFPHVTDDIHFFNGWADYALETGLWTALSHDFMTYPPVFTYFFALAAYLPGPFIVGTKLLGIIFDYAAAWIVYQIVKLRYATGGTATFAGLAVLFAPSVIVNSSMWGQVDNTYTTFLLASTYYLVRLSQRETKKRDTLLALLFLGVALSWKPQAVFLVLPIALLYVRRRVTWLQLLLLPAVYLLSVLPNYLAGRPAADLVLHYWEKKDQVFGFTKYSYGAPTAYQFLPYGSNESYFIAGMLFGAAIILLFVLFMLYRRLPYTRDMAMRTVMTSLLIVPFVLPGMHERYFFPADIMSIVFAFYFPRYWFLPVLVGGVSLLGYLEYLLGEQPVSRQMLALGMGVAVAMVTRDFVLSALTERPKARVTA